MGTIEYRMSHTETAVHFTGKLMYTLQGDGFSHDFYGPVVGVDQKRKEK